MATMYGAIFVIAMLILAAAVIYFVVRGAGEAVESAQDTVQHAREEAHLPEPGATVTPPATGLLMEDIPAEHEPSERVIRRE